MSITPDRYVAVSATGTPEDPQAAADLAAATQAGAIAGDIAGAAAGAVAGAQAGTEVAASAGAAAGAAAGEIAGREAGTASGATAGAVAGASAGATAGAAAATAVVATKADRDGGGNIQNAATWRTNLGLGDVATRNVGTTAGTAAAGDDSRIVGAAQTVTLAASGGSSGVGFTQGLMGAGARTLQAKGRDTVSVADFVGATDADKLLAAASSGAQQIIIPDAGIDITSAVTLPIGAGLSFGGKGVVRVSGVGAIRFGTGTTALPDLSTSIVPWTDTASFVAPHGLSVGDVFGVENPTDFSFAKYRAEYHDGQMFRVIEVVDADTVRFSGNAKRTFAPADVDCFVLNEGPVDLSGLVVDPTGSTADLILTIDGSQGARIDGLTIRAGGDYTGLEVYRCYDWVVGSGRMEAYISDAYPIVIVNSQKGVIYAGTGLYSSRHCIAFGGRLGLGAVPCADVIVLGGVSESDPATNVGSIDVHGNCEDITYSEFIVYQSANLSGRNVTLRNSKIYARNLADGNVIYCREVVGGTYDFDNCTFVTAGDGTSTALLNFIMEPIGPEPGGLSEDLLLRFRNCSLEYEGSSIATARLIRLDIGATWVGGNRIDVEIDNWRWPIGVAAPFAVVTFLGASDVSALSSVTIQNAGNFPAGTLLFLPTDAVNNTVPVTHDLTLKGVTSARPANPTPGQQYFDTTLDADGKPIWWTGTDWVDATGAVV